MSKKRNFLIISCSLAAGAVAASALAFIPFRSVGVWGTDDVVWNHYDAVAASLGVRGTKEYWVSCSDHSHQLTAPVSANIVDKGAPSREFINSLDIEDDRLIEYKRYYDFSDGHLPSFITTRQNVSSVVVGHTLDANNDMLEVSISGNDYGLNIGKEYLDIVFADPNVTALAFDAYSTEPSSNFRHKTAGSNVCYEKNEAVSDETGYGVVSGGFKTFYFNRSMYNNWADGDCVIWGGGSVSPKTLYIDNLRVASRDASPSGHLDFDGGAFNSGANDYRIASGVANFAVNSGDSASKPTFNYEYKTSGTRSITVNKSSSNWASFTTNSGGDFYKNMPDEGFLIDLRSTSPYNHSNGIRNGQSSDNLPWQYVPGTTTSTPSFSANTWYTYHIQKTRDVNSSGRFMQIAASTTGQWYIDDIRYVTGNVYGFEGACVQRSTDNAYVTVAGQEFAPEDSGVLRDQTFCYKFIMNNGANMVTYAGLDSEHVSEGAQALKVTFEHTGYNMMSFEPFLMEALDSVDTISIDVYSDGVTFAGGTLFEDVVPGQWTTITFSKSQLTTSSAYGRLASKAYRTQANISTIGSLWFDNIRTANVD